MNFGRFVLIATALIASAGARAKTILFVGNSFTQGAHSPVRAWGRDRVTDLNYMNTGGVPAIFKTLADEAGLDWTVSLETQGGKGLDFHYEQKRAVLAGRYDVVVLQGLSELDRRRPGDPTVHNANAALLAQMFRKANPQVAVALASTWSRADLTYPPGQAWSGKPINAMAEDLAAASALAIRQSPDINYVIPVGAAWNRAFAEKVADPNPYDGTSFGQVDLWTYDHYHASAAGYYLEALTMFGAITGVDPTRFGPKEKAADELGLAPELAERLQHIAAETLAGASQSG